MRECQKASLEAEENGLILNLDASRRQWRLQMSVCICVCLRMYDHLHVTVLFTTCNCVCGRYVSQT